MISTPDRKLNTITLIETVLHGSSEELGALIERDPAKLGEQILDLLYLAATALDMLAEACGTDVDSVIAVLRRLLMEQM